MLTMVGEIFVEHFPELPKLDTTHIWSYQNTVLYVDKKGVPKISLKTEKVPHKNLYLKDVVAEFLNIHKQKTI